VSHGMSLFSFSVDGVNAIPASTTNRNILDGTTTPTASTLGWPVDLEFLGQKQGTGASSSNISVTAWAYLTHAPAFGASEGTVTFKDQDDNDLGTLDGFGVTFPAWVSTGFSIASNVTRIEVYGQSASGIVDPEAGGEDVSLEIGAIGIFLGS
jgi:hypothetical protein